MDVNWATEEKKAPTESKTPKVNESPVLNKNLLDKKRKYPFKKTKDVLKHTKQIDTIKARETQLDKSTQPPKKKPKTTHNTTK
jgi:hypothetical protein